MTEEEFEERFIEFIGGLADMLRKKVVIQIGPNNIRLVVRGAAYGFVRKRDGAICYASEWRKAGPVRGSIFDDDPLRCCGPYGVKTAAEMKELGE